MPLKWIHVGTGGWGGMWCKTFLPPNAKDGLIEVVAAVDAKPDNLKNAREGLGLPESRCYSDVKKALEENKADVVSVVVPPAYHEQVIDAALPFGVNILCEKPIADTLEASARIATKVKRAGVKMGVTMSHRFDQDKTTLRSILRSGQYGRLDYLVSRFTCDCRIKGSWGQFRHEIADTLLIEGSVHHLDFIADMAGGLCDTIYAQSWNPAWGEFKGDSQALVTMRMDNGRRAFYEGAKTNAVGLNQWAEEYVRAECEGATLILSNRALEVFPYTPGKSWTAALEGQGTKIPLLNQPKWANTWLIEKFVGWVQGGEPMETNVQDNLQSVALVFGAIQSSRSGNAVKVQELLAKAMREAQ